MSRLERDVYELDLVRQTASEIEGFFLGRAFAHGQTVKGVHVEDDNGNKEVKIRGEKRGTRVYAPYDSTVHGEMEFFVAEGAEMPDHPAGPAGRAIHRHRLGDRAASTAHVRYVYE